MSEFPIHNREPRVVVVGGGIAGLAAAHRIHELAPQARVVLLEASARLGGLLKTEKREGYLTEEAADNFITQVPGTLDFCERIGFSQQLISTNPLYRGALVVRSGRLRPIPDGFLLMAPGSLWPMLTTRVLSLWGKLRMALELCMPVRREEADESLASFVRRRLGNEVYQRLVEPLVGSIYGTDPAELSLAATFPHFAGMEQQHGSLWKALRQEKSPQKQPLESGARYSQFVAPRKGMTSLVETLAAQIPGRSIHLSSPVDSLCKTEDSRWAVLIGGEHPRSLLADAVILAAPAFVAARLLQKVDLATSEELARIDYRGGTLVTLGYERKQIGRRLESFGVVVPACEHRNILSASFSSVKYRGRAPADAVQIRVFLREDKQHPLAEQPDEVLQAIAAKEMEQLLKIRGAPQFCHIARHQRSMPIYRLGHLQRIDRIEQRVATLRGLALAGAAYKGVGVPHCIRSGQQAAESVLKRISHFSPEPARNAQSTSLVGIR